MKEPTDDSRERRLSGQAAPAPTVWVELAAETKIKVVVVLPAVYFDSGWMVDPSTEEFGGSWEGTFVIEIHDVDGNAVECPSLTNLVEYQESDCGNQEAILISVYRQMVPR